MSWSLPRVLLSSLLLASPLHAATEVIVGSERPLSQRGTVPAVGWQGNPVAASSSNGVMVAWQDETEGRSGLYVARLTAAGELIDGSQRHVSDGAARDISISWNGAAYVIVWSDLNRRAVRVASFSGSGEPVLPPATIAESATTIRGASASLHGRSLVFHQNPYEVAFAATILGPSGSVEKVIRIAELATASQVIVRTDGQNFFIFTRSSRIVPLSPLPPPTKVIETISVFRVTPAGDLLDAPAVKIIETAQQAGEFDVAFDGDQFAVVCAELAPSATSVRRSLVDPHSLQSTPLVPVETSTAVNAAVVSVGTRFVALWSGTVAGRDTLFAQSFDSASAGPIMQSAGHGGASLRAVWTGESIVAFWHGVFGVALDPQGVARREKIPIDLSPLWQLRPAIGGSGSQSLVVWCELNDGGTNRVVGTLLDHGQPGPVLNLSEPFATQPSRLAVAWTGSLYAVTWDEPEGESSRQIVARRVSTSGQLIDPAPVRVTAGNAPAIASNGSSVLLTWLDNRGTMGLMLSGDGELPANSTPIQVARGYGASIATNGDHYLVVTMSGSDYWQDPGPNLVDVEAVRVAGNGAVLDLSPIVIAATERNERWPAVASDGRDFLVTYLVTGGMYGPGLGLEAKRVLAEGALAEGTAQSEGTAVAEGGVATVPALAFSGAQYVIAWRDVRGYGSESNLLAAIVAPNGRSVELLEPLSSSILSGNLHVALAGGPGGVADIVYNALEPDAVYGPVPRLLTRRMVIDPKPRTRRVRR